jgi:hypothetical protein
MLKWKKKKIKTHTRHYSIIIYDENAMEIGNKNTQYNVRKIKHAIITQRYKCLLHTKFGNQPYPDDTYVIYIQSNLSYVTFQGNIEKESHKTGGRLIQV